MRIARVAISACLAVVAALSASTEPDAAQFPPRLLNYLAHRVQLGAAERSQLLAGRPVTRLLDGDASKEVAVFGAIWIGAPVARYVEQVSDIENFERGSSFRMTKRISSPPRLEDFAALRLPVEDINSLRRCRLGDCDVKLGEQAVQRFRSEVQWSAPDAAAQANRLMQRIAFEYVNGYLEGGNERLAVYRDNLRPTFVAQEFGAMVAEMPELTAFMPGMRRYLLGFPRETIPGATSFLYWQDTAFGLKPTIRISHLTILQRPEDTVVASKMLYASHYFWTGLELRVLMPDPARGAGFWFVTVNRSRLDGLSGFTGLFVRHRVRSEVQRGTLTALQMTKRRLEAGR